jgi:SAM-dependent methyltransferase
MKKIIQHILNKINVKSPFDAVIDHGCGIDCHYSLMLKNFAKKVIGVDIEPKNKNAIIDEYIEVPMDLIKAYFPDMSDGSIDAVFVIAMHGFDVMGDWAKQILRPKERIGRYLNADNFYRLLKKGGYLIVIEWESFPHRRFYKKSIEEISEEMMLHYYPSMEYLDGVMKRVTQGFHDLPYIVYQKI